MENKAKKLKGMMWQSEIGKRRKYHPQDIRKKCCDPSPKAQESKKIQPVRDTTRNREWGKENCSLLSAL